MAIPAKVAILMGASLGGPGGLPDQVALAGEHETFEPNGMTAAEIPLLMYGQ